MSKSSSLSLQQSQYSQSSSQFLQRLSHDLTELLDEGDDYNVLIEVGESPNNKVFKLHSMVLRHRSPYFRRKLADFSNINDKVIEIKKKHVKADVFQIVVRYIYGGFICLEDLEPSVILQTICIAEEFGLEELVIYIENYLLENQVGWLHQNFALINRTSFQYEGFHGLQRFCTGIVARKPDAVFESEDFTTIQESALVALLQRDDLRMEEWKIWDKMIKWGIAQTLTINSSNAEALSNEDFVALKTTLKNCLPLIRYFHMSPEQFFDKVLPFEKLLPKSLLQELLQHFMIPHRPLRTKALAPRFSTVITEEQSALISTWIDNSPKIYEIKENPYELKLILRGSRDGFRAKRFHELCENKQQTVVVMKVHGTNEILGGYNPNAWGSHGYGETSESFIFSIDEEDLRNSIRSCVKNANYALDHYSYYGPIFGSRDLALEDNFKEEARGYCKKKYYDKPIRKSEESFSVDDYEVFQVVDRKMFL